MILEFEYGLPTLPDDEDRKSFQLNSDYAKSRVWALDPLINLLSIGILLLKSSKRLLADGCLRKSERIPCKGDKL